MTVLIDSDVLIEVSLGRDVPILSKWADLGRSDALIVFSPVNEAELWAGARPTEFEGLKRCSTRWRAPWPMLLWGAAQETPATISKEPQS